MLEVGWTEILVIAIVLIIVVGPKDLPQMLRTFGRVVSKLRGMAGEFRQQFDEALREADLDDVRKTIGDAQKLNPMNAIRDAVNPLRQMGDEIKSDLQKATSVGQAEAAAASSVPTLTETHTPGAGGGSPAAAAGAAAPAAVAGSPAMAAPVQPVTSAPIAQATDPVAATARAIEQASKARKPVPAAEPKEPEPKPTARKTSAARAKASPKAAGAKTTDKIAKPASKTAGAASTKTPARKPKKDQA